jgi:hypothetical protein
LSIKCHVTPAAPRAGKSDRWSDAFLPSNV